MLSLFCGTDKKLFVYVLCSFKSRNIVVRKTVSYAFTTSQKEIFSSALICASYQITVNVRRGLTDQKGRLHNMNDDP